MECAFPSWRSFAMALTVAPPVLAIEPTTLSQNYMPWMHEHLGPRYCVFRACAHATVIYDRSPVMDRLVVADGDDLVKREALESQAPQDEDLDVAEVIHHLHQQAKSSPVFENAFSRTERSDAITPLVTSYSVPSPSLLARSQGRPLSSFHRLCIRQSLFTGYIGADEVCNFDKIIPDVPMDHFPWPPEIFGASFFKPCVVWHLQFDIVDLFSPRRLPTGRAGKRRRTTINQFHQVPAPPEQDASPRNHPPEAKRYKGVRYRLDRRKWAAEMKPPKSKDKVTFGEFNSQEQAARAIDAAFHYYGKPHLLNFPDTPEILSSRPSPAGVLNEKDQLSFVKEQVKWLASVASTLPCSPPLVPPEIPESSSRGSIRDTFVFRTLSEVASFLSCGVADESDDGTSQPLPPLPPDVLAEFGGRASMGPPSVGANAIGSITGTLEEHRGMPEGIWEDPLVAPSSSRLVGSSVQITDGWDVVEESSALALMNLTNSAEPSCESQGSWKNYLR